MTDQPPAKGIVAWLETAITRREEAARAAHKTNPAPWTADILEGTGLIVAADGQPLWDCEGASALCMTAAAATHAALSDPRDVLRRCAADRKLLALHRSDGVVCTVCADEETPSEDSDGEVSWSRMAVTAPCPTVLAIAEGYGWTPGQDTTP